MKIGIIAEGHSDRLIIQALLKRIKNINDSQIVPIRPVNSQDETDRHDVREFSNWTIVFEECRNEETFEDFFDTVEEERYIVVQIDTAECEEIGYEVKRPNRSGQVAWDAYSVELRNRVIAKLQMLIPIKYHDRILYAVSIEELEAWLIPIWDDRKVDTAKTVRAKEKLGEIISGIKKKNKYRHS